MKYTLRRPSCAGCPHDLYYMESIPKKQFGLTMHSGQRFCTGGKRARRFKRGDPKVHVPLFDAETARKNQTDGLV